MSAVKSAPMELHHHHRSGGGALASLMCPPAYQGRALWRSPFARAGLCLLLASVGLGAAAGCKEDNALLVTLTAEARVDSFDIYVLDRSRGEVVFSQLGEPVVVGDSPRDISQPGESVRLTLLFARKGRYLIHVVGRSSGPRQVATQLHTVNGTSKRKIHLVPVDAHDNDGDGFLTTAACQALGSPSIHCEVGDCNDNDPLIHPLAIEICGNGIDENCDGHDRPCRDADGDGSPENEDCDDNDPDRFPGNPEAPNSCPSPEFPEGLADPKCDDGIDQDCDGKDVACIIDEDCDGYPAEVDCDDNDPTIHPGAKEVCGDGIDNNCNGLIDEGCVPCDLDGDGYERYDPQSGCPSPTYPHDKPLDCDDTNSAVFPGITDLCDGQEGGHPACAALRLCDGIDNDCDGLVDEGCPSSECDQDGDGFMRLDPGAGCNPPPGFEDCNDNDHTIYPGAPDRCGDGIAQNCNMDTPCTDDRDGDGYNSDVDCDDNDPTVHPWATEVCDGIDNNCNGLVDEGNPDHLGNPLGDLYCNDDPDGLCGDPLGSGRCVCARMIPAGQRDTGRVVCPGEDLSAGASPRCFFAPQPTQEKCDPLDHDCDGRPDAPEGTNLSELGQACGTNVGRCVAGFVVGCDLTQETAGATNPHFLCDQTFVGPIPEICNGIDDDCDGVIPHDELDHDGDGYLGCTGCSDPPPGASWVDCNDCAPNNSSIFPGAFELCNGIDDNCTGLDDDGADQCIGATPDCCGSLNMCVDFAINFSHCGGCSQGCSLVASNLCVGGQCRCGSGLPCGSGQQCVGTGASATCQCTATSCPSGCCSGTTCHAQTLSTCGTGGAPCIGCDTFAASLCTNGQCRCGTGSPCPSEQQCVGTGASATCQCNSSSCPLGCCSGTSCVLYSSQNTSTCGTSGATCAGCTAMLANLCTNGQCRCGTGPPCATGQQCVGTGTSATCQCNNTSCPLGCCNGTSCVLYASQGTGTCGTGGAACGPCDTSVANLCTGGQCRCGTSSPCGTYQECVGTGTSATCQCNSSSCPLGCCNGTSCVLYTSQSTVTCGAGGATCGNCGIRSDNCTNGQCRCGSNAPCATGQQCVSGACQCTATSCPNGCCAGTTCNAQSTTTCGTSGGTCVACDMRSDRCTDGQCRCGTGAPCAAGQQCVSGACQCTSSSCPDGCCAGTTCNAQSHSTCGTSGGTCVACDIRADRCTSGQCRCGTGAICATGQECVSGACQCTAASCPNGCCDGTSCVVYADQSDSKCGTGGATCAACNPSRTCTNGVCE